MPNNPSVCLYLCCNLLFPSCECVCMWPTINQCNLSECVCVRAFVWKSSSNKLRKGVSCPPDERVINYCVIYFFLPQSVESREEVVCRTGIPRFLDFLVFPMDNFWTGLSTNKRQLPFCVNQRYSALIRIWEWVRVTDGRLIAFQWNNMCFVDKISQLCIARCKYWLNTKRVRVRREFDPVS